MVRRRITFSTRDRDPTKMAKPRGYRRENSSALGANRTTVRHIFDITSAKNFTRIGFECCSDRKPGIYGIRSGTLRFRYGEQFFFGQFHHLPNRS